MGRKDQLRTDIQNHAQQNDQSVELNSHNQQVMQTSDRQNNLNKILSLCSHSRVGANLYILVYLLQHKGIVLIFMQSFFHTKAIHTGHSCQALVTDAIMWVESTVSAFNVF